MADARISQLGITEHAEHAMGDYSVALDMPSALTAIRASNGVADPMRAYISIVPKGFGQPEGVYIDYATDEINGYVQYDTSKGEYAALCYALAVIRKRNAVWVDGYKPYTKADWDRSESKVIS